MKIPCTGVILAGGLNSRFLGQNKAFIRIGGRRIIDRIFSVFEDVFEEILLVTNNPIQYAEYDCLITTDIFPIRSSLTGIHAGLFYASTPYTFFSACDTPFLKRETIEFVLETTDESSDITVPAISAGFEPLCAVYSKRCLPVIERQIAGKQFKIQLLFKQVRVKKIPEESFLEQDPRLLSFFNINTLDDVIKAEKIENKFAHPIHTRTPV